MSSWIRLPLLLALVVTLRASDWQLVSVTRIWDQPPHAAFGDILRWNDRWYVVFREGKGHMPRKNATDDGQLRLISSVSGNDWTSEAVLTEDGVDLRDPHLSLTPENRLMIVAGGSYYPNGEYTSRQSRVFFSRDGRTWTPPQKVVNDGDWLWRVTWDNGAAYGVAKNLGTPATGRTLRLVSSPDGVAWNTITELKLPGGDETTVRFLPDHSMVALVRRSVGEQNHAYIGTSRPPYQSWDWQSSGHFIGGPNFIILPDGQWVAGGRLNEGGDRTKPHTEIGELTKSGFVSKLRLPSAGDNSYPGFAWHDQLLWVVYYSSHEGKTSIYLAKIRLR